MAIFKIDNETFNVPLVEVKREAPVIDKYAERTEKGEFRLNA